MNITNIPQRGWKLKVKGKPNWKELFNSDSKLYWGSGDYTNKNIICEAIDKKRKIYEIIIDIPALGAMIFE